MHDTVTIREPKANGLKMHPTAVEADEHATQVDISALKDKDYVKALAPWRYAIRTKLVERVKAESKAVARLQRTIRTSWLDTYFVYSSYLGTDTFFLVVLPAFFFFGYDDFGRGLLMILALGGYASSSLKDLFCSPRPFSPPVTRLTLQDHHLEYGFPSTHTTQSSSIALYFLLHVPPAYRPYLFIYAFTIIFGRLYTGMHTFIDCITGCMLGALAVWVHSLPMFQYFEAWVFTGGLAVPLVLISLFLFLLEMHPLPVDPCPCFEDSIASGSVALGALLGRWGVNYFGMDGALEKVIMPGSSWAFASTSIDILQSSWVPAALKMFTGMSVILSWRLLAKAALAPVMRYVWREEVATSRAQVKRCRSYVLTKVVVYAGIATLACDVLPPVFDFLGWA
ncbi:phosphatidic acid phosphatase type 2/haloperoxidase [Desarmillaria tabescens]|uniref:Phosphatidic acid phosphatase type 2/haloperoxidase n=1 Tax=Armillaria tabescens TaxID=1929756 RepID=A0AA39NCJ7_ARMTA|nr:phosphatidic acid phosphatase type 2/haloperoxidase [Desarmillaria tabescens]KAK0463115.1 phosphatidic acid phosphatase type 2/haloperoxidase [Desarmillaria tabescens]